MIRQRFQLGDVLQGTGPLTQPHSVVAAELLRTFPVLTRPSRLKELVELTQLTHQARITERLLRQRIQLVTLLLRERVPQSLCSRRALRQRIQKFLDVARVVREILPVLVHELRKLLRSVDTPRVRVEQLIQISQHLANLLTILVGSALECLLHSREALIEDLTSEQITNLLVIRASLFAAPVVVGQILHGLSCRRR